VEDESALLRYLSEKGLQPGTAITVKDSGPGLSSPLMLEVGGNPVALGRDVARRIWVRPIQQPAATLPVLAGSAQ
jgi:Fe2+ transport system protein FeoA